MSSRPPNILLVITDQQQAALADPTHPCRLPHLRELAAGGVRFDRAYTPCPLCVPARVSLMGGVYPHAHGLIDNSNLPGGVVLGLKPDAKRSVFDRSPVTGLACFSEGLKKAGYQLGWSGRWHVFPGHHPSEIGFDFFDWTEADDACHRRSFGLKTHLYSPERIAKGRCLVRPGFAPFPLYGKTAEPLEAELDIFTVEKARQGLERLHAAGQPWFMGVGLIAPHDPYVVPEPYASMYDPAQVRLPASFADDLADKPGLYRKQRDVAFGDLTEQEYREMIACYWGFNTLADDMLGRLLQKIEDLGVANDTVVIFTSDHGDNMGAHRLLYKTLSLFEETIRIPLVVRWPHGVRSPGRDSSAAASLLDIAPTVLELAGQPVPADYHGRSLIPVLRDRAADADRPILVESEGCGNHVTQRCVVAGDWKYIYNGYDVDELYDLAADPAEMSNLAGLPSYRTKLEDLVACLWAELKRTGDTTCRHRQPHTMLLPVGPQEGSWS